MTMIDVDTSPLQAAREWRGIGLVAVAMNCGLPVAQAEALEAGDTEAFDSVDEMLAAAVLYGASLGIGRDEAMALLDRTVGREAAVVNFPNVVPTHLARPNQAFSGAVQERSARIADRDDVVVTPPIATSPPAAPAPLDEPVAPAALDAELPAVPTDAGPSPEAAVAASGELHLDDSFSPDAPWERSSTTGELEAWVDDFDGYEGAAAARERGHGVVSRVGHGLHAGLERVVGTDRADSMADGMRRLSARASGLARTGRDKLRNSEHATPFVAIGAGAVLIAIVVALGGALGGDDPAGPGPAERAEQAKATTQSDTASADDAATGAKAGSDEAKPAATAAVVPSAKITVDVYNAGSQKGRAKEVADQLKAAGYRIGEVTNAKGDYAGATIIHPQGMTREARQLARRTGITTLQEAPGSTRHMTVIVA